MALRRLESGSYLLIEDGTSFRLLEEALAYLLGPLAVHFDPFVAAHVDPGVAVHVDPHVAEGVLV